MATGRQPDLASEDTDAEGGGGTSIFAEINITPLTDVFLVMVVIFMVSALAVQAERNEEKRQEKEERKKDVSGLEVNLPPGVSAELDPSKQSLIIEIPLDGKVYVNIGPGNSKVVSDDELERMFRNAYAANKNTQIILKADRGVQHGRVVGVMDRAKQPIAASSTAGWWASWIAPSRPA
jgi:biopolymer transport protein ExbD